MTLLKDEEQAGPSGAVERYTAGVEEYKPRILMGPDEAKALDAALRENMLAVLREGTDYGVIPGTGNKPSLLKPGAEKLLQWFGFGHAMDRTEVDRDADGGRLGVTYRCTVTKGLPDGRTAVIGMCDGYAGYDEDRFYTSAEAAEAKERANAERYRRNVNKAKFAEYRAPWNSVIKMAQKRAMVGAALQATSASSLFTQDVEDDAPAAQVVAQAAKTALGALPDETQSAVNRWWQQQGWAAPGRWDAAQWCLALIQAGRISGDGPAPDVPGSPAGRQAPSAPDGTDQDWLAGMLTKAGSFAAEDDGQELWKEINARGQDGKCSGANGKTLKAMIRARWAELREAAEPLEGVVVPPLDPADPWFTTVEGIASPEDAGIARRDLDEAGITDETRLTAIRAAIVAKVASLQAVAA